MELSGEDKLSIVHKVYQKYYPSNAKHDVAVACIGAERRKRLDIPSPAEFSEDWMEPPQTICPTYGRDLHSKFEVLPFLRGSARSVEPLASLDPCRGPYTGTRARLRLHKTHDRQAVRNIEILARLRLRPTSHVERHLTTPEPPAGSAGSSLEPSCHEPRWKFGSTVKIRGAQECLARLRLRPTSHVERHLTTPEPPAGSAGSSLEPSCHEPRWKFGSTVKIRGAQECRPDCCIKRGMLL